MRMYGARLGPALPCTLRVMVFAVSGGRVSVPWNSSFVLATAGGILFVASASNWLRRLGICLVLPCFTKLLLAKSPASISVPNLPLPDTSELHPRTLRSALFPLPRLTHLPRRLIHPSVGIAPHSH